MLIKCKDKQGSMSITKFSVWMIAGIGWKDSIVAYDIINSLQKIKYYDNVLAKPSWLLLEDNDIFHHF